MSDAIDVWKDLLEFFEKNCNSNEVKKLKDRYDMAVTPPHFLANMLDPIHIGSVYLKNSLIQHCNTSIAIIQM